MKSRTIIIIFICMLFLACDSTLNSASIEDTLVSDKSTKYSSISHSLDTTILLTDLTKSNYSGQSLTSTNAKKILYSYFKSKGYYTKDNLSELVKLKDTDYDKLVVVFL